MLDKLITAVNKLQNVFNTLSIGEKINWQLPEIVMVGAQSTGKSSTLESIVRHSFLPRGKGIVTRCPLILQLIYCPLNDKEFRNDIEGTDEAEEWGQFMHTPQIYTNFDDIRKEIENQTLKIAGTNKGIKSTPITLRVYSPKVVNLTLVDLPGLIKVAVGDQPDNIEVQTLELIMKYIKNPNSIILSVSSADADLATSESLKIAKEVDPEGKRTLAVLTKLDRVESVADIADVLTGNFKIKIPVKLGVIGIVNRNQNEETTIEEQLELEKEFLEKNFPDIANRNGIPYLEQELSNLLIKHIQKCLPALKGEITKKLEHYRHITKTCGEEVIDRNQTILKILGQFSKDFCDTIDGVSNRFNIYPGTFVGGPALRKIIDEKFSKEIRGIQVKLAEKQIINSLDKIGGSRPLVFAPEILFFEIVKVEIEKLRNPSLGCAENIRHEIEKVVHILIQSETSEQHYAKRFPILARRISDVIIKLVAERMPGTLELIDTIIEMELASINTNHPDFSVKEVMNEYLLVQEKRSNTETFQLGKKEIDAIVIEKLIVEYFSLEKKKVEDSVPKCIMYKLVNFVKENVHNELLTKIDRNEEGLLVESEDIAKQRKEAKLMTEALRKAEQTIDDVYDSAV